MDFYVDYSESGDSLLNPDDVKRPSIQESELTEQVLQTDTVLVPKHHFSINPFSPFLLGINLDYMYRIGYNKRMAIHVPFRYFTFLGEESLVHTGVGFNFIPYNSNRVSTYIGVSTQFYHFNRKTVVGFPITIGFVVSLNQLLTINGYGGVGPFLGNAEMWKLPLVGDLHIGLGFKIGEKYQTTNTIKVK